MPDLSFGTHFFQDLVEAEIRYLPLYPDAGSFLNTPFLHRAQNLLPTVLPEYERLADTIRVVDVSSASRGRVLRVHMNSELDEAVAILAAPDDAREEVQESIAGKREPQTEVYWRWRMRMVECIASELDAERFGVVAMYVIGSTKNASAGPNSDIDLLIHVRDDESKRHDLELWLHGWSLCLGEMNYLRTGYTSRELLDVHIITDDDISRQTSFAAKIGAVTDAALELTVGTAEQ
jgi:predicted nucleotidyltransferase